jgi:class 3 adenylate cyclase
VLDEPVRGGFPDPPFLSLPGLDQMHIASRVQTIAGASEILVSSTVRELVTGSGLRFVDHGRHALKGIEGEWQLFAVAG